MFLWRNKWLLCLLFLFVSPLRAQVVIYDDLDHRLSFNQNVTRIASLSPYVTEMLYFIGAQKTIVARTQGDNYPADVKKVVSVGDFRQIDIERLLITRPELVVVWQSGPTSYQVKQLENLNIPVFYSYPKTISDVSYTMQRLALLTGQDKQITKVKRWYESWLKLQRENSNKKRVSVFYQVSNRPIYTLNDNHVLGEIIKGCGGQNVFGNASVLAPMVSLESVLEKDPDVIVASHFLKTSDSLSLYRAYPTLKAVKNNYLFEIDPDLLDRPGPRLLQGAQFMCEILNKARK